MIFEYLDCGYSREFIWVFSIIDAIFFVLPYAGHYKLWLVFFFNPFFTAAYILEGLILQSGHNFVIIFGKAPISLFDR